MMIRWFQIAVVAVLVVIVFTGFAGAQEVPATKEGEAGEKGKAKGQKEAPAVELEDVVVTGTRTRRKIEDSPVKPSVITKEEIEARNVVSVDDALQHIPGLYRRKTKGMMDTLVGVQLRGFKGRERTLVMLDGFPIHSGYTGVPSLNIVPIEEIERIEVVRGPFSALYGGHAMGGVVNIIIRRIPKEPEVRLRTGYGMQDTHIHYAGYSRRLSDVFAFRVGYTVKQTGGYCADYVVKSASNGTNGTPVTGWRSTTDKTGTKRYYIIGECGGTNSYKSNAFTAKLVFKPTPLSDLSLYFISSGYTYRYANDFKSYLVDASGSPVISGDPADSNYVTFNDGGVDKRIKIYEGDFLKGPGSDSQLTYLVRYQTPVGKKTKLTARLGFIDQHENWYILPDKKKATLTGGEGKLCSTPSKALYANVQAEMKLADDNILTFGVSQNWASCHSRDHKLTQWLHASSTEEKLAETEGKSRIVAAYIQDEWKLHEKVRVVPALRFDHWECFDGSNYDSVAGAMKYKRRHKDSVSPKLSVLFRAYKEKETRTTLRASVGKAFRSPTVYELYHTWKSSWDTVYQGNPNLKPETAVSWEFGVEQKLSFWDKRKTLVAVTYFGNDIENLIYYALIDPVGKINERQNAGVAKANGIEMELKQEVTPWLMLWGNYTNVDARIRKNPAKPSCEGKRVTYVPREMWNAGLDFKSGPLKATFAGRYFSKIFTVDDNSDKAEGVPQTFEPSLTFDFKLSYEVNDNLTAAVGVENIFNQRYFEYSRTPGASVLVEFSLKF